ncbi:hypothetical protein [Archangium sp.]|uniref:hypothetical protein n=1 Tax=Archangium sp. TaxID=1872627 RepID=UPI002D6A03EE|nr:hypothetical protein [Archangium sp.]HYO51493.1 hypothetical protein [Archangium sp.]
MKTFRDKTLRDTLLVSLLLVPVAPARAQRERPARTETAAPAPAVTDTTLSLLEPAGEGCEWAQVEPLTSARRVIAKLAVDCQGGSTALSRDGRHGAARFWRGGVSAPVVGKPTFPEKFPSPAFRDRLFLVDLATGGVEEIPLPPSGELIEFGFDAGGRLLGLTLQKPTPAQERTGVAEIDGSRIVLGLGVPGRPLLAHAFSWREGTWTRLDVKAATELSGTRVLALREELGERSSRSLDPRFVPEEIDDDALLDQLYALTPEQPDGEWSMLKSGGHTLAVWGTSFGEELLVTGLLRRVEKGKVIALPGIPFRANDLVSIQSRGPFLLVSLADSGGHPRMYRGRKPVWSSESARAVTFWPK